MTGAMSLVYSVHKCFGGRIKCLCYEWTI